MKQKEVAELILRGLYDQRDRIEIGDIGEVARSRGVADINSIERAAKYLDNLGLLEYFDVETGPIYSGNISALGVQLVEQAGEGQSVMDFIHRQDSTSGNVNFYGPVDRSAIAVGSPHAQQTVRGHSDTLALLDSLMSAVDSDESIPAQRKAQTLEDAASLKGEIVKDKPNWRVVNYLLAAVGAIASAAKYANEIRAAFVDVLPRD